jgi:hypothetical protein
MTFEYCCLKFSARCEGLEGPSSFVIHVLQSVPVLSNGKTGQHGGPLILFAIVVQIVNLEGRHSNI